MKLLVRLFLLLSFALTSEYGGVYAHARHAPADTPFTGASGYSLTDLPAFYLHHTVGLPQQALANRNIRKMITTGDEDEEEKTNGTRKSKGQKFSVIPYLAAHAAITAPFSLDYPFHSLKEYMVRCRYSCSGYSCKRYVQLQVFRI